MLDERLDDSVHVLLAQGLEPSGANSEPNMFGDDQAADRPEGGIDRGHEMDLGHLDEIVEFAILNCLAVDDRAFKRERKRAYRRVISELYSPPRVTRELSCMPNALLVPGYALDLTTLDPHDGGHGTFPWHPSVSGHAN